MAGKEGESAERSLIGLRFGQCELSEKQSDGGSASVYRAWHRGLGSVVAVKVLYANRLHDRDAIARFRREPKLQARVADHPNVVRVLDAGEALDHDGRARPYIVMDLLDGSTLEQYLAGHGKLTEEMALEMAAGIVSALRHLHRVGLVHRDLKPSNIFLCRDGSGRLVVKVLDWGIAREIAGGFTTEDVLIGTRGYFAPEQAKCELVDAACDQFQLGLILCEAITGERVLADSVSPKAPGKAIRRALERPELRERQALCELLHGMLQVDPKRRWPLSDVEAKINDLRATGASPAPAAGVVDEDTIKNTVGEVFAGRSRRRKQALALGVTLTTFAGALWFVGDHLYRWTRAQRFLTPMQHIDGAAKWTGGRTDLERSAMAQMKQLDPVNAKIDRQVPRQAAIAPFDYDTHEVTWQQLADWLNLLWFVHIDTEIDSNVDRWVKDWRGRKLLDLDGDAPELVLVSGRFVPREGYAWRAADGIPFATAKAYCEYFGKRLPTENEFEFAYRGNTDRWFPWTNELPETFADCDRAVFDRDPDASGRSAQCARPGVRALAGDVRDENQDVVNGIRGLMGNVSEWTSTPYVNPADLDPEIHGRSAHVVRGGNYLAPFGLGISTMRQRFADDEMLSGNGFRCAR